VKKFGIYKAEQKSQ